MSVITRPNTHIPYFFDIAVFGTVSPLGQCFYIKLNNFIDQMER